MNSPRLATEADAAGIAHVHVCAWRETYRGIVPDAFLTSLSEATREVKWRQTLAPGGGDGVYVAGPGGAVVGFGSGGVLRSPDLPFTSELFALYVLRAHQGRGLGRKLFQAVVLDLLAGGHDSMMLWVLRDNPAVAFFRRMGGEPYAEASIDIGGAKVPEVAIGWADLRAVGAVRQ